MADLSTCPSRDDLQRMLLGKLPAADAEEMESQLNRCPTCSSVLQQCVGCSSVWLLTSFSQPCGPAPCGPAAEASASRRRRWSRRSDGFQVPCPRGSAATTVRAGTTTGSNRLDGGCTREGNVARRGCVRENPYCSMGHGETHGCLPPATWPLRRALSRCTISLYHLA
jgi:hypothetical protein